MLAKIEFGIPTHVVMILPVESGPRLLSLNVLIQLSNPCTGELYVPDNG